MYFYQLLHIHKGLRTRILIFACLDDLAATARNPIIASGLYYLLEGIGSRVLIGEEKMIVRLMGHRRDFFFLVRDRYYYAAVRVATLLKFTIERYCFFFSLLVVTAWARKIARVPWLSGQMKDVRM